MQTIIQQYLSHTMLSDYDRDDFGNDTLYQIYLLMQRGQAIQSYINKIDYGKIKGHKNWYTEVVAERMILDDIQGEIIRLLAVEHTVISQVDNTFDFGITDLSNRDNEASSND